VDQKKKNPTRRLLIIIGLLVVVFVAFIAGGKALGILGGPGGIAVETAEAELRDVTQLVTASGRVQPETEVKISPDVSGEIIFLGVAEGQQVVKGDLLIRIRPDFYEAQFERAQAGVSQARAGLSRAKADRLKAELDLQRAEELFERNVVAESEYETASTAFQIAEANLDAAEYQVEAALAAASEAQESLSKTSIYSPMTGTVSMLNVELGERVVGTIQFAGTEMLRIARLDQMEVEAEINENDVVNISLGDTARIEVDAYPGRAFRGVVTEIANSARIAAQGTQEQVTNFPVKVRILDVHNLDRAPGAQGMVSAEEVPIPPDDMPQFRPGMSSTVDIYTDFVAQAVAVPIQAVTVRDFAKLDEDEDAAGGPAGEKENQTSAESDEAAASDGGEAGLSSDADSDDENRWAGSQKEDLRTVVFLMNEGTAEMVEVETGISDASWIQITTGIDEGALVITGPYSAVSRTLSDGNKVKRKEGEAS
jgi:HlyD family secretion protein